MKDSRIAECTIRGIAQYGAGIGKSKYKSILLALLCIGSFGVVKGQQFQLGTPRLLVETPYTVFFTDSTRVKLVFDLAGATVHYTLDGSMPAGNSPVCSTGFLTLYHSAVVRAIAVHPDYLASDPVHIEVIKLPKTIPPTAVVLQKSAAAQYASNGVAALIDGQKGTVSNMHRHWLGFQGDTCAVDFTFSAAIRPDSLLVSTFSNISSWIFPPKSIEVWAFDRRKKKFARVGMQRFSEIAASQPAESMISFTRTNQLKKAKRWRVLVIPYGPIPEWHAGKGNNAWLFVDEIRFY